ncbi:hypothetical protein COE91_22780 [Bacillus toyonensis]|nr:hypothetical protein COE91_22780 [Bacillus toyonensis]
MIEITKPIQRIINQIEGEMKSGAKSLASNQVDMVLEAFTEKAKELGRDELTKRGLQYVDEIEELRKKFKELGNQLDIKYIKQQILGKAEEFGEAYLRKKVSLPEDLPIKTRPRVILDFNLDWIYIKIEIFIMKQEDPDNTYRVNYLVAGSLEFRQRFSESLHIPDLGIESNPNLVENYVKEIKKEIDKQKEKIIAQLVNSFMEDYVPPLMLLKNYIKIF